jgi:hypothetical protein
VGAVESGSCGGKASGRGLQSRKAGRKAGKTAKPKAAQQLLCLSPTVLSGGDVAHFQSVKQLKFLEEIGSTPVEHAVAPAPLCLRWSWGVFLPPERSGLLYAPRPQRLGARTKTAVEVGRRDVSGQTSLMKTAALAGRHLSRRTQERSRVGPTVTLSRFLASGPPLASAASGAPKGELRSGAAGAQVGSEKMPACEHLQLKPAGPEG